MSDESTTGWARPSVATIVSWAIGILVAVAGAALYVGLRSADVANIDARANQNTEAVKGLNEKLTGVQGDVRSLGEKAEARDKALDKVGVVAGENRDSLIRIEAHLGTTPEEPDD